MAQCKDCIHEKVCLHKANIETDTYAYMGVKYDTEKCKHYTSADVVPKSEVERLEAEKDALIKNYAECMKDYAREIFEEIENTLNQWIELYYTITVSTFDSIDQAKARASESVLRAFRDYIVELKKKYTKEGEDKE